LDDKCYKNYSVDLLNFRVTYEAQNADMHECWELIWRHTQPHQWQPAAVHVTRQSSTASVLWHHGSSSKHCCIVLQIL